MPGSAVVSRGGGDHGFGVVKESMTAVLLGDTSRRMTGDRDQGAW